MAPHSRRHVGASRRKRRDEEGEDEGSVDGGLEEDSLSEGSIISHQDDDDADGEGSDESEDDASVPSQSDRIESHRVNGRVREVDGQSGRKSASPVKQHFASTVSDTEAMLNGIRISEGDGQVAEIHFDDSKAHVDRPARTPSAPPAEQKRENFTERKRREHEKYVKEWDENPALVPTRGSFFLHDKRSTESGTGGHNKSSNKSKSRPYGLIVDGNVRRNPQKSDASDGQWTHDLHETVANDGPPASRSWTTPSATTTSNVPKTAPAPSRSSPPNRSFSNTTLIGNVPVVVFLPGMERPIHHSTIPKRQHTRLPQHRPPLRRDKPVRISLPGQPPRYIFPSTERSFIFIPRALRPNQQSFRGRGRGGFYGGRRPSLYMNPGYSPGVAMSRRSSIGRASHEGFNSPAGSVYSSGKPVVRLPLIKPPGTIIPAAAGPVPTASIPQAMPLHAQPQNPAYRESRPAPIPMHQPRPQKAVSVADIESPASFPVNPPQPQREQPFHQQVPLSINGPIYGPDASTLPHGSQSSQASTAQLSHIPERAIHAQPFQPYSLQQPQGFYPSAYPPGTAYYPVSGVEFAPYSTAIGPASSMPAFPPPAPHVPYIMPAPPATAEQPAQPGTVAHESGGTVYYYDAAQLPPNGQYTYPPPAPGGVVGMGGMMTPGTTYYYAQPQPSMYYAPQ